MTEDKDNGWVFDLEADDELPELDGAPKAEKTKNTDEKSASTEKAGDASASPAAGVFDEDKTSNPQVSAEDIPAQDDVGIDAEQPPADVVEEIHLNTTHDLDEAITAPSEVEDPPVADKAGEDLVPEVKSFAEEEVTPAFGDDSVDEITRTEPPAVENHDVTAGLDDFGVSDDVYATSTAADNLVDDMQEQALPSLEDDEDLPDIMLDRTSVQAQSARAAMADLEDDGKFADRPEHEREFFRVLKVLSTAEDLGVDTLAVARIRDLLNTDRMPQLIVKDLVTEGLLEQDQLARAIARSKGRLEIMTVQDMPEGARNLRKELDSRAQVLMRDRRIVPIRLRTTERGTSELHLAYPTGTRDLIIEAQLVDIIPGHKFIWHYATRDVCGQYWLSGDEGTDVDEGMEAEALLDRIISTAVDSRASDIHIDPSIKGDAKATIKYRVDGFAQPREIVTQEQLERLRVRIENVARMPKVNLNHPNKGAFTRGGFDWRVQIQPHAGRQGPVPRIVIRKLNPDTMSLERLGYPKYFINKLIAAAKAPNGAIFWTGPTGSGKTESIHSAVISANPMARGKSVHTIEDPPEKRVEGYAVQMEIAEGDPARSALELLKSSLRADPDVVIFGEVRDSHMAKLVFEAANTGHLVFSTLHTNTSIDALVRLQELGIEGFMLSYIRGIAAQRLARRLCTQCRVPMDIPDDMTRYVFDLYGIPMDEATLYTHHKGGCPNCNFTGYKGRIAVAEWLEPSVEMIEAAGKGQFSRIEEIARRGGWKPMGHMGALHVKDGITDVHELQDVIVELAMAG